MKYFIHNNADNSRCYGEFPSIEAAIAECNKGGYNITGIYGNTVQIIEHPSF